jgi:hypothetical protein
VESKTNLKPETKIVVVHHSILRKAPSFWPGWFLGYISTRKESARRHPRAKRALLVRPGVAPVPPALFPNMLIFGLPTSTHFFLLKIPKRVLWHFFSLVASVMPKTLTEGFLLDKVKTEIKGLYRKDP